MSRPKELGCKLRGCELAFCKLQAVFCDDSHMNLHILIRNKIPVSAHLAYATSELAPDKKHFIQKIYFSTDSHCAQPSMYLANAFDSSSDLEPKTALTLEKHGEQLGLFENQVYCSFYPVLVHEVGHAFGLCNLYDDHPHDPCSSK